MLNKLGRSFALVMLLVGLLFSATSSSAMVYRNDGCKWVSGHWRNGHWVHAHRVCWRMGGHHCYWVRGHWGYGGYTPGHRVCR